MSEAKAEAQAAVSVTSGWSEPWLTPMRTDVITRWLPLLAGLGGRDTIEAAWLCESMNA